VPVARVTFRVRPVDAAGSAGGARSRPAIGVS
jgi:hypothetical protein